MFFWFIKIIAFIPFWILFPTFIKNKKKIPKGKCIIIANHRSNLDPLILLNVIWREQHCVAKKELFKNKMLSGFLKKMKAIPIDRDNVEISTIKLCLNTLKKEKVLTIFPEGTRNKTLQPLLEIKNGASVFAVKSGAPIVPIWIKKNPKLFCFNTLVVGEPFYISKEDLDNGGQIMRENLLKVREMSLKKKNNRN